MWRTLMGIRQSKQLKHHTELPTLSGLGYSRQEQYCWWRSAGGLATGSRANQHAHKNDCYHIPFSRLKYRHAIIRDRARTFSYKASLMNSFHIGDIENVRLHCPVCGVALLNYSAYYEVSGASTMALQTYLLSFQTCSRGGYSLAP